MDVSELLFYVLWLLPGVVLGIAGTLVTQKVARSFHVEKAKSSDYMVKSSDRSKVSSRDQKSTRLDAGDDLLGFLSQTKRVRKVQTCSNMTKYEQVQLCAKCFKLS